MFGSVLPIGLGRRGGSSDTTKAPVERIMSPRGELESRKTLLDQRAREVACDNIGNKSQWRPRGRPPGASGCVQSVEGLTQWRNVPDLPSYQNTTNFHSRGLLKSPILRCVRVYCTPRWRFRVAARAIRKPMPALSATTHSRKDQGHKYFQFLLWPFHHSHSCFKLGKPSFLYITTP